MRWNLSEELFQLKQTGYEAIGLWRPKLVEYEERSVAEMLQKAKLSVSSLSFAGGFTGGSGFSYGDLVDDGHQAINQASAIGAKNLIVIGGPRNGHTVRHSRRMVVDALYELGRHAAAEQVKLSLLPMHYNFRQKWTFLNSLNDTLDLIDEIGNPQIGLVFDTFQLFDEPRLIERIPEIAKRTAIVQISDCDRTPQSQSDRLIPGEGKLPLKNIIQTFQRAGYAGYFDIQVWSSNVWRSNYSHLIEQTHAFVKEMSLPEAVRMDRPRIGPVD